MLRRSDVVAISLLLVTGCGRGHKDEGGKYKLRVEGAPAGTTVLVSGKPVGVLDQYRSLEIALPKGVFVGDGKGSVVVRLDTACGPKDVPIPAKDPADFEVEKYNRSLTKAEYTSIVLTDVAFQTLWVDRTRAPGAKVTIGQLELRDDKRFDIVWPACADGRVVRVDGTEVGTLPETSPKDQDLVIATAPGCYQLRQVAYVQQGGYGRGQDDLVVSKTQLAWVRQLDYFLESAPSEVASSDVSEMKNELLAVPCGKQARRARH